MTLARDGPELNAPNFARVEPRFNLNNPIMHA